MVLFLVLKHRDERCSPSFISLWDWNFRRGPEGVPRASRTTRIHSPTAPLLDCRPELCLLRRRSGFRFTMALGLLLAVVVNQKIRGQTFFRGAFYFPAMAGSAAITVLWMFILSPTACSTTCAARSASTRSSALGFAAPQLARRLAHGDELGDRPERLDDVGHVHALLPGLAPDDQPRGLRGRGDRWRQARGRPSGRSPSRC